MSPPSPRALLLRAGLGHRAVRRRLSWPGHPAPASLSKPASLTSKTVDPQPPLPVWVLPLGGLHPARRTRRTWPFAWTYTLLTSGKTCAQTGRKIPLSLASCVETSSTSLNGTGASPLHTMPPSPGELSRGTHLGWQVPLCSATRVRPARLLLGTWDLIAAHNGCGAPPRNPMGRRFGWPARNWSQRGTLPSG